jgi:hypothetical protein
MANNQFMAMQPSNASFEELIGNGVKYIIPKFQRDYAWEQEQWEDLWADITELDKEYYHYMGYVVLQRKSDNTFEVIDGQQRLITLSIIVLAALKQIEKLIAANQDVDANTARIQVNREKYIGFKHPVTLTMNNKLTLNRNNAIYFKKMSEDLLPANSRNLSTTNKLLRKAFEFFEKQSMGLTGEKIAQKIYDISKGMIFTKIVVDDDLNAYKVFETLNARGVQLSTPDLLKNYIFSVVAQADHVHESDLDDLDQEWSDIISNLGNADFSDFVRYHHHIQQPLANKKIFGVIKDFILEHKNGISYLKSMSEYAPIFSALLNPQHDWWSRQSTCHQQAQFYLETLALFNIKQPIIILMVAFKYFSPEEFLKLARYLYVLSIRYNVVGHQSTKNQERIYNQIAMKIHSEEYKRASNVKNDNDLFKKLYPDDDEFKRDFEWLKMPSRQSPKKIKFLLTEIEKNLDSPIDRNSVTLEHICPYELTESWRNHFGDGVDEVYDRLGNMVLLAKDDLQRKDFAHKKQAYLKSGLELAGYVAKHFDDWTMESVNHYQQWLAQQAVHTWCVDFK